MKNRVLFAVTIIVVFGLGILASSVINRKSEAKYRYVPQVEIGENEPRNSEWGKNFPQEYQSYLQTVSSSRYVHEGPIVNREVRLDIVSHPNNSVSYINDLHSGVKECKLKYTDRLRESVTKLRNRYLHTYITRL